MTLKPGDYCSGNPILLWVFKGLFEWIANMEEEFITGVLHNRKENFGYATCSKYLAYSIESQVAGLRIQTSVIKSFYN